MTSSRAFADATHVLATHIDEYLTDHHDQLHSEIPVTRTFLGRDVAIESNTVAAMLRSLAADLHALEGVLTAQVNADALTLDLDQ